jgi:hypothetical protein
MTRVQILAHEEASSPQPKKGGKLICANFAISTETARNGI